MMPHTATTMPATPTIAHALLRLRGRAYALVAVVAIVAFGVGPDWRPLVMLLVAAASPIPPALRSGSSSARLKAAMLFDLGATVVLAVATGGYFAVDLVGFLVVGTAAFLFTTRFTALITGAVLAMDVAHWGVHLLADSARLGVAHEVIVASGWGGWVATSGAKLVLLPSLAIVVSRLAALLSASGQRLAESNLRFDRLVQAAPHPIVVHRQGVIISANPAAAALVRAGEPEELLGETLGRFVSAHEAESERDASSGGVFRARLALLDGSERIVDAAEVPTVLEDGPATQLLVNDVTDAARAAAALRESEEELRLAFGDAAIGMAFQSLDGRIERANDAMGDLLGLPAADLVGRSWSDFTIDSQVEEDQMVGLGASASGLRGWRVENLVERTDGTRRWLLVNVSVLTDSTGRPLRFFSQAQDVTERRRAEEALRESEQRLQLAFGSAAIGMALVSLDGRYEQVNEALCQLLGYPEQELLGKTWRELTHPDDLEASEAFARRSRAERAEGWSIEKRFIRGDGTSVWVLLNVTLLTDDRGEPIWYFSQTQDISDRKRAETALRESEERHKSLFERIPVALYRTTPDGRVVAANPALRKMFGFPDDLPIDEQDGLALETHALPTQRDRWRRKIDEEGVVGGFEQLLVRPDGRRLWVEDSARAIRDEQGRVLYYEGAMVDVTERRRAQEGRERLARILEATSDLVVAFDATGRLIYANRAARSFYGVDRLPDLHIRAILTGVEDDPGPEIRRALLDSGSWAGELSIRSARGQAVPVDVVVQAHRSHTGRVLYVSAIARDISERKASEQRLEQLVRSKDEFVASVSHELRTPLTAVVGLAQELRLNLHQFSSSEALELIGLIAEQGAEVANIVEDLLVAARADIGTVQIHDETVDVAEEIQSVLRALPADRGKSISFSGGRALARGDGRRVRQVLRNLLINALRYGGEDIRVTITSAEPVVIEVSDDGHGIATPDRERVFNAYERAHRAPTQPGSVGLGLHVSRQLSRLMQGDLTYDYRQDRSVFRFSLPPAEEEWAGSSLPAGWATSA